MLDARQLPYVLAGVFLMTLQPLLVTLSQDSSGHIQYSAISSTLLTEGCKLVISALLLWRHLRNDPKLPRPQLNFVKVLEYSVPALIYFINNNLVFAILSHVSATTFQLLSQLKTVFTGLLFRFFLGRKLSIYQYLAIWQLACGTAMSQIPQCTSEGSAEKQHSSVIGLLISILSCILSAFGGIYSEKLLKSDAMESIHFQNLQLYTWGIAFNLVGMLIHDGDSLLQSGLFSGYNGWAYAVVANNVFNGLAISAILKYADNIARVYAHACAMLVTMVFSIFLFGQSPTPQLVIAICVVGASAMQYNIKAPLQQSGEDDKSGHAAKRMMEMKVQPEAVGARASEATRCP
mmetsp:Transcript_37557/g.81920  ORF Transcript_37557/g.81920 Transcript_37557/m.81920 type:complete len:348 (-) Transcript_37557:144-1187(-)